MGASSRTNYLGLPFARVVRMMFRISKCSALVTTTVALITAPLLGVTAVAPTEAQARHSRDPFVRHISANYEAPGGAAGVRLVVNVPFEGVGGAAFETGWWERFASVKLEDSSGHPAWALVGQDSNFNGTYEDSEYTPVCGSTDKPIPITPGIVLFVEIQAGPCLAPSIEPAFATWGTIRVTLADRRKKVR